MRPARAEVLRDQGRGVAGALLIVGTTFLYTMETWWLAWELPMTSLLGYAFAGLAVVFLVTRNVGFRRDEDRRRKRRSWRLLTDYSELLLQSFLTAYLVLLLLGIIDLNESPATIVRLGLLQVVPLGFGASLANVVLAESEDDSPEGDFPRNVAVFSLGAMFVVFPVAPTQEMEVIARHMDWERTALLVVAALAVSHLLLYELDFRGQSMRVEGRTKGYQVGTAFVVYAVAALVSIALLAAFGHFAGTTLTEGVQQIVVLSFPASIGASAGEVVI